MHPVFFLKKLSMRVIYEHVRAHVFRDLCMRQALLHMCECVCVCFGAMMCVCVCVNGEIIP